MFSKFKIKNVRMFEDDNFNFNLNQLTVLCGTNGSGKSTIFKTLLLLKQSQALAKSSNANRGQLVFKGEYVDLGNYDSFVSYNKPHNIEISITNIDSMPRDGFEFLANYAKIKIKKDDTEFRPYELETKFVFTRSLENDESNKGKRSLNLNNVFQRTTGTLSEAHYVLSLDHKPALKWHILGIDKTEDGKIKRKYFLHIPESYFKQVGGLKLMCVEPADEQGYIAVEVILKGLFPDSLWVKWKLKDDNRSNKMKFPLPPALNIAITDFIDRLDSIHHIGPLRAPGKRYYLANDDEIGLDSVGEFLPYILRDRKDTAVYNCFPDKGWDTADTKLIDALNYWLYYFRTGTYTTKSMCKYEIAVKTKESVLVNFDLKSQNGDHSFSLADSGFGYSQILPIIVKCLLANFDDTIIIEQPELHLNPALQVRLAEFLVAMSFSFKQIIIETHSEHIVNTIRVLSAESAHDEIREQTKIFFIENKKTPTIHELTINADGHVANWPKEFFGEALSLSGRLLRAQKQLRTKKKEESNCLL